MYCICSCTTVNFSALTLLVRHQEGHPAFKNWVVGCWHGYLSAARCRLAYGPSDATVPLTVSSLVKSRYVSPFLYWLIWVVPEKGPLNVCIGSSYTKRLLSVHTFLCVRACVRVSGRRCWVHARRMTSMHSPRLCVTTTPCHDLTRGTPLCCCVSRRASKESQTCCEVDPCQFTPNILHSL